MTWPFVKRKHTICDLLSVLIWDLGLEFLFKSHYKLHHIEAVRAEIVDKTRGSDDLVDIEVSK